jgi:threonine dehydrogenase-like Zn-dependent dehydrogenase
VRVDERDEPRIVEPTDAIIRVSAACVCGSDLWPYRGVEQMQWPAPMGHEYAGIVEEVGDDVQTIKPGQFVVGSFWATDNTCEICRAGYQSGCVNRVAMGALGAEAELLRVPLADGTLVATPDIPSVVEAVGTQQSMNQAIQAARPGGHVGFVGVAHGVAIDGMDLFWSLAHLHGGPAPVRRFLPQLIELICNREIDPGKVFDLTLPLEQAAEGYRAMDERRAIKTLLRP